jgi:cystathionine beta-lyase
MPLDKHTQAVSVARGDKTFAGLINVPVCRTSTVAFADIESYERRKQDLGPGDLRYGRHGTQTSLALAEAIRSLEGGDFTAILPNGLAAIVCVFLAYAAPGRHILVTASVYAPARRFLQEAMPKMGVELEFYEPAAFSHSLLRDNTVLVYCESPGSQSFDMQDIPAICAAAAARSIPVAADNTWATPYFFDGFAAGLTISIQAGTKYIGGHADLMLGSVTTTEAAAGAIRHAVDIYGYSVSPDDCYLALRGLRTMPVRLDRHHANALAVAGWLKQLECVADVNYPCLPGNQGHALWKAQMRGGASLFSFTLKRNDQAASYAFVNALAHFTIGSSWGGYESLITISHATDRAQPQAAKRYDRFRIHIGLEDAGDLIRDLDAAFVHAGLKTAG